MKLPADINSVSHNHCCDGSIPYPPLGFFPFYEHQLGNGDAFGLYWPLGGEESERIVAEVWYDEWRLVPGYSGLRAFLRATRA